jgi:hypothetical protein
MQLARRAFSLALAKTGKRIAARIAMKEITTKSSIRVKALLLHFCGKTSKITSGVKVLLKCPIS